MTKKTFNLITHLIANIMGITYNAYHINLELTLNDEKQIISDIREIHKLSPNLDNSDLNRIKSSLPHSKGYAGGSLGDLVMNARLVHGQLVLAYDPKKR